MTIKKNKWIFDEGSVFSDATANILITETKERKLCDVNSETESLRFSYEWVSIKDIESILREYKLMKADKTITKGVKVI